MTKRATLAIALYSIIILSVILSILGCNSGTPDTEIANEIINDSSGSTSIDTENDTGGQTDGALQEVDKGSPAQSSILDHLSSANLTDSILSTNLTGRKNINILPSPSPTIRPKPDPIPDPESFPTPDPELDDLIPTVEPEGPKYIVVSIDSVSIHGDADLDGGEIQMAFVAGTGDREWTSIFPISLWHKAEAWDTIEVKLNILKR